MTKLQEGSTNPKLTQRAGAQFIRDFNIEVDALSLTVANSLEVINQNFSKFQHEKRESFTTLSKHIEIISNKLALQEAELQQIKSEQILNRLQLQQKEELIEDLIEEGFKYLQALPKDIFINHLKNNFLTVQTLASRLNISPSTITRKLRSKTDSICNFAIKYNRVYYIHKHYLKAT